jgi:glycerol-3-phosphate cytidylyltransferase
MKRVITYGTYDLLHWGHVNLLKRAKQYGDYLIVALSTDEFNGKKGKNAYHNFEQRKLMLEAVRYVDLVIPEETWEQKTDDILKYQADIFLMGDDWEDRFPELQAVCEVVYVARTPGISTTFIKQTLNKEEIGGSV